MFMTETMRLIDPADPLRVHDLRQVAQPGPTSLEQRIFGAREKQIDPGLPPPSRPRGFATLRRPESGFARAMSFMHKWRAS